MKQARGGRGDQRSLIRRADSRQGGSGADALFARLDALGHGGARTPAASAELLLRWAERVRSGMWNDEIAALVARAEALERQLDARHTEP
jgi:hypothetical protein